MDVEIIRKADVILLFFFCQKFFAARHWPVVIMHLRHMLNVKEFEISPE
jgi:hypothetical protein